MDVYLSKFLGRPLLRRRCVQCGASSTAIQEVKKPPSQHPLKRITLDTFSWLGSRPLALCDLATAVLFRFERPGGTVQAPERCWTKWRPMLGRLTGIRRVVPACASELRPGGRV